MLPGCQQISSASSLSDLIAKALIYMDILIFCNMKYRLKSMSYPLKSDRLLAMLNTAK